MVIYFLFSWVSIEPYMSSDKLTGSGMLISITFEFCKINFTISWCPLLQANMNAVVFYLFIFFKIHIRSKFIFFEITVAFSIEKHLIFFISHLLHPFDPFLGD